jgi:uncharacterized protein
MPDKLTNIPFDLKEVSDLGEFVGIASVYGNVDLGGDIVLPGAFTKTIAERGNRVRLLDGHKVRVGIATIADSPEGLMAKGQINLAKQSGKEALSDIKFYRDQGMPMGMSIGYRTVKSEFDKDGNRLLKELTLYEVTITEFPMNEKAQIVSVKSVTDLISKAKWSREAKDDFNTELAEIQLMCSAEFMLNALSRSLCSLVWESGMSRDERISAAGTYIQQFSESFMAFLPAYLDYFIEEYGDFKMLTAKSRDLKVGRTISSATNNQISTAHEHVKSATDILAALIESAADGDEVPPDTGDEKAATERTAEPVQDHSAAEVQTLIELVRSRTQAA